MINNFDMLVDDRPQDGVFKVAREAFTSSAVFDLEMSGIFERAWNFVGLESQLGQPGDFFTTTIGRQPLLVMRDELGRLGCFFNSCRHKGALLCPERSGHRPVHTCRYHGWKYNSAGDNVFISAEASGQYPACFGKEEHGLVKVPGFESYRGFLFARLSAEGDTLAAHLGDARVFIDMIADQAPHGLEVLPGTISYTFDANWKLQFENGLDFYHFSFTHGSYVDVLRARHAASMPDASDRWIDREDLQQGAFSFPQGHAVMWANRNSLRVKRPFVADEEALAAARARVSAEQLQWMQVNRNLTIFPNLQLIDVHSLQMRTWRPLAPDRTEMTSWCLAPVGEPPAARLRRLRQYEDFFNPSGLATADDNVMYELCQSGLQAHATRWTEGYLRGLGGDAAEAEELTQGIGISDVTGRAGSFGFGDETCLHPGYRRWQQLLAQEDRRRASSGTPTPTQHKETP